MENQFQHSAQRKKGKFIAFEGIDGSGKSTQVQLLTKRLKENHIDCYATMEPTHAPIGTYLREILMGRRKADPRVTAFLFAADRLDHLLNEENGIAAKVSGGTTVITDRYYFSSYAYHSGDMPMDQVIRINEQSQEILRPTVTVFIDIDADTAMERILRNRDHQELFEKKSKLAEVRLNYFEAFDKLKDTEEIIVVNGNGTPEEIAEDIWDACKHHFALRL